MRRLILILAIAVGLSSVTWLREPWVPNRNAELAVTALPFAPFKAGGLRLTGLWQLESPNEHFHGYSALVALDDGRLLAASDRGRLLIFSPPGATPAPPVFGFLGGKSVLAKSYADVEALTRDPVTGKVWAVHERINMIRRYRPDLQPDGDVWPEEMLHWRSNTGAESMVRLADGRFIVLAEADSPRAMTGTSGLLFASDPVARIRPVQFRFHAPEGYRPVDMAQLPDGRVLVLLRSFKWGLPPRFQGKIVVADPSAIKAGGDWRGELLADLAPPLPIDNYEGLAVQPMKDGRAIVWIMSDDNEMRFQRTLLLRFVWSPNG